MGFRKIYTVFLLLALAALVVYTSPALAEQNNGKLFADCGGQEGLGEAVLCRVMTASMSASLTMWQTISNMLLPLLGILFAYELMKILWSWDPESVLRNLLRLVMRTVFGFFIITNSTSFSQFYGFYTTIEELAVDFVSGGNGKAYGQRGGGSPQMGALTGVIMNIPDTLYGGMTLVKQTSGEATEQVIGCLDFTAPDHQKVLAAYFNTYDALGARVLMCLSESIAEAVKSDSGSSFVKYVSVLAGRQDGATGHAVEKLGTKTKKELTKALTESGSSLSLPDRRRIEDTLTLWDDFEDVLNLACAKFVCAEKTSSPNESDIISKAITTATNAQEVAVAVGTLGLVPFLKGLTIEANVGIRNFLFQWWAHVVVWPYWVLVLVSWGIWGWFTWTYIKLALLPAIAAPILIMVYTAFWASMPLEGQFQKLLHIYRSKLIKLALGPAIMILLSAVTFSLIQGILDAFKG